LAEYHHKPFFDDISPTSGERERLENGTKQEKLGICQTHLMLWSHMLAAATNSEFKSKSNDDSQGAGPAKSEHKSKRIKSQANKSQIDARSQAD
jgi:hypothetical protein